MTYIMGSHTTKYGVIYSKYRKNENALAGNNEGAFSNFFNTVPGQGTNQESVCAPTVQVTDYDLQARWLQSAARHQSVDPTDLMPISYWEITLGSFRQKPIILLMFVSKISNFTAQDEWRVKPTSHSITV